MKKTLVSIYLLLTPFLCNAAQPSDESIEKLLTVAHTQKMVEGMIPQIEAMMKSMEDKMVDSQNLSPEENAKAKELAAATTKKMMPIMKAQLSWENLKKIYFPIYRDSFSLEEIDGLIAFYSSPAGKAMVEKMPIVMQKSMAATQQLLVPMLQQMQKAMTDASEELKQTADNKQ